ncbi:isonitrile hydratase [Mycolicibacterium conceptionense]|uniref:Glutamine amidotransferase n=1 Tax=Mycolicibacterium conceptionense TaxID=451644 RepID=A0A0U1DHP2_9MYCO|nr:DJ-1/PfpI family protein [Mycolicibacterium conceptionense]ORV24625.1 glutamine amidotransferase [Mycolicibacterium conceptionense]CQD16485.1 isonitrile hydratase [Mycolicibacterium conceptionense]
MREIAIVLYPGVTALDVVGPYEVLRLLPDTEIRFVWHVAGPVIADSGVLALGVTHTLAETPDPDIVLVPGGSESVMVRARDERLLQWLRQAAVGAQWMTSVCAGSVVLAAAGLLDGRPATSHWQAMSALKLLNTRPVHDQRIVIDGRVATAAGVSAGIDLALWLAGELDGPAQARAIQLAIEYDPQPPYDEGHYSKASTSTKLRANMLLAKDSLNSAHVRATGGLMWDQVITRVRGKFSGAT